MAQDEGHVFHVECFVVPSAGEEPSVGTLSGTQRVWADLDWRLQHVVIVPVTELPGEVCSRQ